MVTRLHIQFFYLGCRGWRGVRAVTRKGDGGVCRSVCVQQGGRGGRWCGVCVGLRVVCVVGG